MSYVDAFYDQGKDIVTVVERVDGKRILKEVNNRVTAPAGQNYV